MNDLASTGVQSISIVTFILLIEPLLDTADLRFRRDTVPDTSLSITVPDGSFNAYVPRPAPNAFARPCGAK
jgi:hypothetical protein